MTYSSLIPSFGRHLVCRPNTSRGEKNTHNQIRELDFLLSMPGNSAAELTEFEQTKSAPSGVSVAWTWPFSAILNTASSETDSISAACRIPECGTQASQSSQYNSGGGTSGRMILNFSDSRLIFVRQTVFMSLYGIDLMCPEMKAARPHSKAGSGQPRRCC